MAKGRKTGGRRKGAINHMTADLKAMIEGALHDAGGRKYLAQQAKESPAAFLNLVGKLVPKDLNVNARISLESLVTGSFGPNPPSE